MQRIPILPAVLLAAALGAGCSSDGAGTARVRDTLMVSDSAAAFSSDSVPPAAARPDSVRPDGTGVRDTAFLEPTKGVDTKGVAPGDLVAFAKTLIGTPYVYASTDPRVGFDCSGFITYVFNHFNISVPRSSIDFTPVGRDVDTAAARPGDLILFTGTNHLERHVALRRSVISCLVEDCHTATMFPIDIGPLLICVYHIEFLPKTGCMRKGVRKHQEGHAVPSRRCAAA
ncbi:MAG: hypothetical protein EOO11_20365 [Chitinophagaceae bacterium]|nr:MAG: hypothetical protein EOO11_20365 [Chitinophagaceae bacterium]